MDPNQWRNFNTPYGQPPGVGSSAELPRLELVTQQTVFSPGMFLLKYILRLPAEVGIYI